MKTSTTARRQPRRKKSREAVIAAFWDFSSKRDSLKDSDRLRQIEEGLSAYLLQAVRETFDLQERSLKTLFNVSISNLERCGREKKPLDPVASERLDRIAAVSHLVGVVFESREAAARWMSRSNEALGGGPPIMLCKTESGANQVRRVLQALEWGGVA
ncbi:antitoxin Xre/MbcA/ParS toxin-binding domain-containing protein [Pseudomonas fluorescens]|uniref:antitoxin Xre/MbcA/ParS toxin-binding domain-containing protein n=1 Tax=Pseudomonas fluorescens TaxID=294 RepID=UPI001242FA75|nr:antitoxin Xre/MbcA/ParS toxin-binding domain-containing protein [Pseudomonas fluorescens]VVN46301.1 hypothetical protein PS676_05773 [Pseudomonas fluorescens]